MPGPPRPVDPDARPVQQFASELRRLRESAGGMITSQARLAEAFTTAMRQRRDIEVLVLTEPPVVGAIELARTAASHKHES
jgi:hypothetical protein